MELFEKLAEKARDHGFPLSGALDIATVLDGEFKEHIDRYDDWLSHGRDGEMQYLRRGRDRRADPRVVFPEAQSIFCLGLPYWRQPIGGEGQPRYARYIHGKDYHERIAERLEALMKDVRDSTSEFSGLRWKVCVDTSAVLERSWAALAGLGWIGKNTTLIHPRFGSYFFIAEILLNQSVGRGPNPLPNYCGNCTRCLDACPTGAFTEAGKLDSRRCISYWTLERRGDLGLNAEDRKKIGTWVAGCDICQEVCPFNLKPSREMIEIPTADQEATALIDWTALLEENEEEYRARIRNSALSRVKPAQFSRNLAIGFGNYLRTQTHRLEWKAKVEQRLLREQDPVAACEWKRVLEELLS